MSDKDADDPVQRAIAQLRDDPLDPDVAARIGRRAGAVLLREGRALARFDRWALDRVIPTVLILCAVGYLAELVGFFASVFGR